MIRSVLVGLCCLSLTEGLQLRKAESGMARDDTATTTPDPTVTTIAPTPDVPTLTCPANTTSSKYRNDITVEFFTGSRPAEGGNWPVLKAEVPKTYEEFMCGIANRTLTPSNCTTECAILFGWDQPGMRTFMFDAVLYDTETVFLDQFRNVLSIYSSSAGDGNKVTSSPDMSYTLIVPKGTLSSMGLSQSDPSKIPSFQPSMYVGNSTMSFIGNTGTSGMHN